MDQVTLPQDSELTPALEDFFELSSGAGQQKLLVNAQKLGLNTYGDMELRLGERIVEAADRSTASG